MAPHMQHDVQHSFQMHVGSLMLQPSVQACQCAACADLTSYMDLREPSACSAAGCQDWVKAGLAKGSQAGAGSGVGS